MNDFVHNRNKFVFSSPIDRWFMRQQFALFVDFIHCSIVWINPSTKGFSGWWFFNRFHFILFIVFSLLPVKWFRQHTKQKITGRKNQTRAKMFLKAYLCVCMHAQNEKCICINRPSSKYAKRLGVGQKWEQSLFCCNFLITIDNMNMKFCTHKFKHFSCFSLQIGKFSIEFGLLAHFQCFFYSSTSTNLST